VRYTQVDPTGVARLDLPGRLPPGKITLAFDYSGGFRTSAEGLFHAKVGSDWYAWTQFESIDARRMFPGFDEPGLQDSLYGQRHGPQGAESILNFSADCGHCVRLDGDPPVRADQTTSYLSGRYRRRPVRCSGNNRAPDAVRAKPLPFRVIATKGQKPRMRFAAAEGPKLLVKLETYFQSAYPTTSSTTWPRPSSRAPWKTAVDSSSSRTR